VTSEEISAFKGQSGFAVWAIYRKTSLRRLKEQFVAG
jgi:hypothetical protein